MENQNSKRGTDSYYKQIKDLERESLNLQLMNQNISEENNKLKKELEIL